MSLSTLGERLDKKRWKRGPQECWPWLGYINADGEARIWVDDALGSVSVAKAIFMAQGIEIPEGKEALSCPILKECSNPAHVSLAGRDEVADRILFTKGLKRRPSKDKTPGAGRKLSDEQIKQIYLSNESNMTLAQQYGISGSHVSNIRAGRVSRVVTEQLQRNQDEAVRR